MLKLTGRKNYFDVIPTDGGKPDASGLPTGAGKKLSYDPLFTLLDLIMDPGYYYNKPLLAVDYLPLRRVFLEAAFPKNESAQQRWLKLQRISPEMVNNYGMKVAREYDGEAPFREGLGKLDQQIEMWRLSKANLAVVAPDAADKAWKHLAELPADGPARKAASRLGAAWKARDIRAANEAIASLAAELPKINPGQYPTGRRDLELTYNRANAFEWGRSGRM